MNRKHMQWKKGMTSILLAGCVMSGTFAAAVPAIAANAKTVATQAAGMPFTDVRSSDWYYNAVKYVYEHKLMAGTSDTLFEPNVQMTRAMMVQVLYAREGSPAPQDGASAFSDVQKGDIIMQCSGQRLLVLHPVRVMESLSRTVWSRANSLHSSCTIIPDIRM